MNIRTVEIITVLVIGALFGEVIGLETGKFWGVVGGFFAACVAIGMLKYLESTAFSKEE